MTEIFRYKLTTDEYFNGLPHSFSYKSFDTTSQLSKFMRDNNKLVFVDMYLTLLSYEDYNCTIDLTDSFEYYLVIIDGVI